MKMSKSFLMTEATEMNEMRQVEVAVSLSPRKKPLQRSTVDTKDVSLLPGRRGSEWLLRLSHSPNLVCRRTERGDLHPPLGSSLCQLSPLWWQWQSSALNGLSPTHSFFFVSSARWSPGCCGRREEDAMDGRQAGWKIGASPKEEKRFCPLSLCVNSNCLLPLAARTMSTRQDFATSPLSSGASHGFELRSTEGEDHSGGASDFYDD